MTRLESRFPHQPLAGGASALPEPDVFGDDHVHGVHLLYHSGNVLRRIAGHSPGVSGVPARRAAVSKAAPPAAGQPAQRGLDDRLLSSGSRVAANDPAASGLFFGQCRLSPSSFHCAAVAGSAGRVLVRLSGVGRAGSVRLHPVFLFCPQCAASDLYCRSSNVPSSLRSRYHGGLEKYLGSRFQQPVSKSRHLRRARPRPAYSG